MSFSPQETSLPTDSLVLFHMILSTLIWRLADGRMPLVRGQCSHAKFEKGRGEVGACDAVCPSCLGRSIARAAIISVVEPGVRLRGGPKDGLDLVGYDIRASWPHDVEGLN